MLSKGVRSEITRRLENWIKWRIGDAKLEKGGRSESPFPAYKVPVPPSTGLQLRNTSPTLSAEAEQTDAILRAMPPKLSLALITQHLEPGTPKDRANRCRCSVATFYHDLHHAERTFFGVLCRRDAAKGILT